MNYKEEVRQFIINNFLFGNAIPIEDDKSFLESDIIDSTGMLELIMFLESTYRLKIEPEEMLPENLDTLNRVSDFITRKLRSAEPTPAAN